MKKTKKIKNMIALVIVIVLALAYYYYLSNRMGEDKTEKAETTEVGKILVEDLESKYPESPRAVIKLYSRIMTCFYNEEYTDEELTGLGLKARELFDEEFLLNNPEEEYFSNLKKEIADYEKESRTIFGTSIESASDVDYNTIDGREYAVIISTYTLKDSSGYNKANHEYLLRKSEDGRWKILGWQLSSRGATGEENE